MRKVEQVDNGSDKDSAIYLPSRSPPRNERLRSSNKGKLASK